MLPSMLTLALSRGMLTLYIFYFKCTQNFSVNLICSNICDQLCIFGSQWKGVCLVDVFGLHLSLYMTLAIRPGFAQVVEHIIGTNMFCLS